MTSRLKDVLGRIQQAEPSEAEWSSLQERLLAKLEPLEPSVEVKPTPAHPAASVVRHLPAAWWGGGVAAGAIAAAAVLTLTSGDIEPPVAATSLPAPAVSLPGSPSALVPASEATELEEWPRPVTVPSAPPRVLKSPWKSSERHSPRGAELTPPLEAPSVVPDVEPPKLPRGESDVEHDRRHLAPVDAALRANEAERALELLSKFRARKLTVYAQALEAMALCQAAKPAAGRRLALQVLTKIPNGGLERRVRRACLLE